MTALAADRNTALLDGPQFQGGIAASAVIYAGALVMRNASGYLDKGQAALNLIGAGRAQEAKTGTTAGAITLDCLRGVFRFANSASTDEITIADIGKMAFAVDDATVAKTSGSGVRSPAGFIAGVDSLGVLVLLDEMRTRAWVSARKRHVGLRLTTIAGSGSPAYRVVCPYSGLVTKISSVIHGAISTGDATLTGAINGTAITTGALTVTQSGSAAGDIDTATPTAANYVTAGQELRITVSGSSTGSVAADVTFEIDADL